MNEEHYMTTDEVLEYLQVKLRTVYRLIKIGQLPAIRLGRQWRFRRHDIDHWLSQHRPGSKGSGQSLEAAARPHILVVDDDETIRTMLERGLTAADYKVDTAGDGPQAIERLKGGGFDLMITDLKMPGMDGLTTIRAAHRQASNLPVIVITGESTEANAIEALNLGVTGYITKPFRMERVLARVAKALGEPVPRADD